MEQTRALNALEPFLALSKSATSPRAAADLVAQATSAPNTYVFAELLAAPNIQALRSSEEHAPSLRLLEIFAWGTWEEYQTADPPLPPLTDAQATKLRLLTLLPLARSHSALTYPSLQAALSLPSPLAVESLLIRALYAGLIHGTLDPASSRVCVSAVAPLRDLPPGSVPGLAAQLGAWGSACEAALADLEGRAAAVRALAAERERVRGCREEAERGVAERHEEAMREGAGAGGRGEAGAEEMEVDGGGEGGKKGKAKKVLGMTFGGRRAGGA